MQVIEAAKYAYAYDFINALPEQFETKVSHLQSIQYYSSPGHQSCLVFLVIQFVFLLRFILYPHL